MQPDSRHGTVAGYNRIPCRDECCKLAMARYKKRWAWDAMNGRVRIVDSTGTRRRIEALMALGWSGHEIGKRLNSSGTNISRLRNSTTLTAAKAAQVAKVYDELSMKLPTGNTQAITNVRNLAARRGYLPPLAWEEGSIDDPRVRIGKDEAREQTSNLHGDIDPIVVDRFLGGDMDLQPNLAEKREIVRRWTDSHGELARRTGWKVERYIDREDGVA